MFSGFDFSSSCVLGVLSTEKYHTLSEEEAVKSNCYRVTFKGLSKVKKKDVSVWLKSVLPESIKVIKISSISRKSKTVRFRGRAGVRSAYKLFSVRLSGWRYEDEK